MASRFAMHWRALAGVAALLMASLAAAPAAAQGLALDARVVWQDDVENFGGYSGFEITDQGAGFLAVSDKGRWVLGRLWRDPDGRLIRITGTMDGPLLDTDGAPVAKYDIDAEGLTFDAAGRTAISFEANHRVWAYDSLVGPAAALPGTPAFEALQNNSGLEALFTGSDGALYAIPERSGALDRPFPVYRLGEQGWSEVFSVPRRPPHLVVGADLGPDGRLYVLERHWNGLLAFASRIRSFAFDPDGLSDERTEFESELDEYDNLEGISVWQDAQGRLRVTTISDDNQFPLQRTEVLEFMVIPQAERDVTPETPSVLRPRPRPG